MKIVVQHDPDCPFGVNGLRAYWEAREAFAMTPPEARATSQDRIDLAIAEFNLEEKQVCTCGADDYIKRHQNDHPRR